MLPGPLTTFKGSNLRFSDWLDVVPSWTRCVSDFFYGNKRAAQRPCSPGHVATISSTTDSLICLHFQSAEENMVKEEGFGQGGETSPAV